MSAASALLLLVPALPLLLAAASPALARPARLLPWAPLPGLLCALWVPAGSAVDLPDALLGAGLRLDETGALFLGLCAFLWACAGAYAQGYLRGKPRERSFCTFWHLTLAGSLGTCLAADVISFYVAFAFLSLAAYVLVIHDREPASLRAGRVYIALAVFGEMALLLGLMLATQAAGGIGIDEVRAALATGPWRDATVFALLLGLGLKAGLVPLHGWLPLAHSAAPVPASAVLSGAIVKAGILGLMRFLPLEAALPQWALVLTWLGLATAWAGVLLGLPQRQPKAVLAYSTMSQMGLLVAVIGAAMGTPGAGATHAAASLYAVHHGLAKGALFLSVGLLTGGGRYARAVLAVAALLGAGMAGLPFTGGALAKLAVKGPLGEGAAALVASLSAIGTMLLVLRFLFLARRALPPPGDVAPVPVRMTAAFALVALAAWVVPWVLFPTLSSQALGYASQARNLWAAAWPILVGLAAAGAAFRWRPPTPTVPVGDVAAWCESRWFTARPWNWNLPGPWASPRRVGVPCRRAVRQGAGVASRLSGWRVGATSLAALALLLVLVLR